MKILPFLPGSQKKDSFFRFLFRPLSELNRIWNSTEDAIRIARSGLFDSDWYVSQNPDIAEANVNPLIHYVRHGAFEGRNPNPLFDSDWYIQRNPEASRIGSNPLVHYIRYGTLTHQDPCAFFDTGWYINQYQDVQKAGIDPLLHYLKIGALEGKRMCPNKSALRQWIEADNREYIGKLLMIDRTYPRPDQDSGSIDCLNYIKLFQEFGYLVFFASDKEYNSQPQGYNALEKMGVLCLNPADYLTIEEFIGGELEGFSAVFLSRVYSGGRFYELIRKMYPKIKIIFNTVDLHSVRERREAETTNDPDKLRQSLKTAERELYLTGQCDATIVVSEYEEKWLSLQNTGAHIVHVPLMREYSAGVKGYFKRSGICFIGDYRHTPNIDALTYFLDDIWPLILEQLPKCTFYIIGYGFPENLKYKCDSNTEILGHVPDLKNWLNRIRVSVAPLRFGAGVKGKVVASLAHGLPCVGTSIAAEGTGLVKDQHIAVEDDSTDFAGRVVQIYNDQDTWVKFSNQGLRICAEKFSFDKGRYKMAQLLQTLELDIAGEKYNQI